MYRKRQNSWEKHIDFMLLDLLCMLFSFYMGYAIKHGFNWFSDMNSIYPQLMIVLIVLDICVVFFKESYDKIVKRGYINELGECLGHCMVLDALMLLYLFAVQKTGSYSRESLFIFVFLQVVLTYIVRCFRKHQLRVKMLKDPLVEQMLILTDKEHAQSCVMKLSQEMYSNFRVIGVILADDDMLVTNFGEIEISGVPIVAQYHQMSEYILNHVVDSVFVDLDLEEKESQKLYDTLIGSGVTVHISLTKIPNELTNRTVENIGGFTVLSAGMRIVTYRQAFFKRAMDLIGGVVGTIIMTLATIVVAPIIFIQSPGPIFFKQDRVGKNGRIFKIYKFRSMYIDAEERKKELMAQNKMDGLMFKVDNDPRITPIGRFIRKYSIDELPQFLNVLKGDMSLVGTRPPTVDEFEQYQLHHRGRLSSKPGITGLWQVSGRSDITDFEEVVELDTKYIANWSVSEDIKILWKTIRQVVRGSGAE